MEMARKVVLFCILAAFVISLSGCATACKQKETQIQGLKNQVSALESQVQSKDEEINGLRDTLTKAADEKEAKAKRKFIGEIKSRPNTKQVQIALKNAGYNPGTIDGRMGKGTRDAIKAFQKAHNLAADGKVGSQTWNLLKEYLYQKAK
jgi:outer membrane murein-binding lipoprotein Lpp